MHLKVNPSNSLAVGSPSVAMDAEDGDTASQIAIPEEFVCPLTLDVMSQPIMTRWGHNFEREELLHWIDKHGVCPLTRNPICISDVIVNRNLRKRIEDWRRQNGDESLDVTGATQPPFYVPVKSRRLKKLVNRREVLSTEAIVATMKKERKRSKHRKRKGKTVK